MKSIDKMSYSEFLDWYYGQADMGAMPSSLLFKTDDPYALARTDYFDPKYSMDIEAWGLRSQEFYKIVPKTTYVAKGDSVQFIASDPYVTSTTAALRVLAETTALFTSVDTDSPDVTDFDYIEPVYVDMPWHVTLHALQKAGYQQPYKMTPEKRKAFAMDYFMQLLDADLLMTCDSYSSSRKTIDSLDMIISCKAEDDASWVNAGDTDVWHSQSSVSVDRSEGTTYDAQVDLPSTEANRTLTLDMIDNLMATAKKYGTRDYIAVTNDDTINVLQKLIDPKERYLHGEKEVQITRDGVQTRKGVDAGRISVSSISTNGMTIPVFSDPNVAVPVSGGAGNLYFIDLGHLELRVSLPITALNTTLNQMLFIDKPSERHDILYGAQLIADKFKCHAAIKYISK
jgi:hypothetical protein